MPLSKEIYKAFEDLVGPDFITDDPATLDTYAFQQSVELNRNGSKFTFRPVAVILPGSTEDVQAVVKACNKYKIKYHAYSTGWGAQAACQHEGVIQLDLRRMDRILEIDAKNMIAVVEPYVINATLQAEAMKVGLNTHMIGAGASVSPLAAATSFQGPGPDSVFMGNSSQNLLALEWVMPTGEILRTGSFGAGAGWFCGEGPGPSTRGIARGEAGHRGGSGVFTKCALRLSPWPGPPTLPVEGTPPAYVASLPENFRAYTAAFPTMKDLTDAIYKIWNAEISYVFHRQFVLWGADLQAAALKIVTDSNKQWCDIEDLLAMPEMQKMTEEMRISFQIVLAGMSPGDIEYKEKALDEILAETNGWKVENMLEPVMKNFTLMYLLRLCFKNYNFSLAGGCKTGFGQVGTPDFVESYTGIAQEVLGAHQEGGKLGNVGADSMMGNCGAEGGGGVHCFEQFSVYDPHDKESVRAEIQYLADSLKFQREKGIPLGFEVWFSPQNREQVQEILRSSGQPQAYQWQRKIKEVFNPNDVGNKLFLTLDDPQK
jgi:glycolate oxidase